MIQIKVDDKGVIEALTRLSRKAQDMSPVMREISGIMLDAVEENFEKEGRPKWPDLAESTKKQRGKKGKWPGKILQVSQGGLASSITRRSGANYAVVGTNKKYAAIQQFGGKAGRGHKATIPARPFLKLTDGDLKEIVAAIDRYLKT